MKKRRNEETKKRNRKKGRNEETRKQSNEET